ncbi:hypothetical protein ACHWQZ_G004550 [Mnemiopsis leidyi]
MLLEYKERQDMNYVNETPFPNPFRFVSNPHRDTIIGVGFMKALNRQRADEDGPVTYSNTSGRFVTVDICGTMGLWNTDMQLQKSVVLDEVKSGRGKKGKWILAMECMSNTSKIVVSTSNRELCFYDLSAGNYDLCFVVPCFDNAITTLHYWFSPINHNEAVLVFGDSHGQIGRLIFSSVQQGLFGADTIKKTNATRRILMYDIYMGRIDGVKLILQSIHKDWAKKVMFVPNYDAFISCSMDQETSLYFGNINHVGEKKAGSIFSVYKGINAFDYSKDYIVSGGLDTVIRIWHYSMINKPTAMMKGHSTAVEHVIVSERTNSIISVSKDTVIKVWDLKDHVCLQTLSKPMSGVHPVTAAHFHSLHHTLVIGSKNFNLGVLERTRKSIVHNVNIKSHQKSVRAALYNHNFNQVVSTSYDSMVCVWDLETGEKVIQFSNCHGNHEITAMTFDPTHRRLLTAGKDGTIKIWNFNNGALLDELQNVHQEEITDIVCCKNTFVTGGWSRKIVVYSDTRGVDDEDPPRVFSDCHHTEDILSVAANRSDTVAYSMYDGSIIVRNSGCDIVLCRLSAANCTPEGKGHCSVYYSPMANTFPTNSTSLEEMKETVPSLPAINNRRISNIKQKRRSSVPCGKPILYNPSSSEDHLFSHNSSGEKQFDCSVDKICFLTARSTSYNTATLISAHSYGIIRAWSCRGGGMLGQFPVIRGGTANDSIHAITTDPQNLFLITGDTTGWVSVYEISRWCINVPHTKRYSANAVHRQPAVRFSEPPLHGKFQCHLSTITNVELVPVKNLIITSSTDCSIRVWTLNGTYIGTFGQSEEWKLRPTSADEFILPDDIRSLLTEDQINKFRRRKRKFNPWKSVKTIMSFTKNAQHHNANIERQLDEDAAFRIATDCDKSYILGKAYHRTTRPRRPMRSVTVGQECGSILAYSQLENQDMARDPVIPNPPNHMKIVGREQLPRFNAQSLDLIAEEQQRLADSYLSKKDESETVGDLDEFVPRSRKFNERNLLSQVSMNLLRQNTSDHANPDICLRNIITVKKAAKRFVKRNATLAPLSSVNEQ